MPYPPFNLLGLMRGMNKFAPSPLSNALSSRLQKINVTDSRDVDYASGARLYDTNRLHSKVDTDLVKNIVRSSQKHGVDPYTALAIAYQESGLTSTYADNPFRVNFQANKEVPDDDLIGSSLNLLNDKFKLARSLGKKSEEEVLQSWNGYGKVGKTTEGHQSKMYGIDVLKQPIDMSKNPVYGKRVVDVRENIIKKNPELVKLVQSIK